LFVETLIAEHDAAMVRRPKRPAAASGNPTVQWGVAKW
jgi:hypothetical protein